MLRGVGFGGKKLKRGAFLLPGTTEAIYEVEGIYELGSQPPGRAERQVITGIGYFEWLRIQDDALNATLRLPLYKKNTTRKWLSIDNLSTLVRFHIFFFMHIGPTLILEQNPAWVHTVLDYKRPPHGRQHYRRLNGWLRHEICMWGNAPRLPAGSVVPHAQT
jgi:hypothetical protein